MVDPHRGETNGDAGDPDLERTVAWLRGLVQAHDDEPAASYLRVALFGLEAARDELLRPSAASEVSLR